ncbi:TetR/AcrR family transcriptional regulator [Nocardioides panacisoli]|uniref:TetR/AcrR family transcriptional regulator n=1 Tax=Nocardioides panacisoli TaxID=627624 RepID=UPI0031D9590D
MEKRTKTFRAGPVRIRVTTDDAAARPKERLTRERIVDAAMDLMAEKGYDGVSMRSLARALDTGQASLYAHVANKEELDQLVIDRICSELDVPEPDPENWAEQLKQVLRDCLELYRAHPGTARAAMGMIPTQEGGLRIAEGMLAICIRGGVSPQAAAWFCDIAALFVCAVAYEEQIWTQRMVDGAGHDDLHEFHEDVDGQLMAAFGQLPADRFPFVTGYARELTAGDGDERLEFGLDLLVSGLEAASERYRDR